MTDSARAIDAHAPGPSGKGLARRLSMAAFGGEGESRLMRLDLSRIVVLLAVASLLGLLCGALDLWRTHHAAAQSSAAAAIAFVDSRLDEIDRELSQLPDNSAPSSVALPCSPTLTARLIRASLTSTLARRFIVGERGAAFACDPEGPIGDAEIANIPSLSSSALVKSTGLNLALSSIPAFGTSLVAARSDHAGRVLIAVLDPRAFAPLRSSMPSIAIALASSDGRRLTPPGEAETKAAPFPTPSASALSQRHNVMVYAEVDREVLIADAWAAASQLLAAVWIGVFAAVFCVWRHNLLRARLQSRIEHGLRKRQFEPFVQPIINLATGCCCGGEVLMRWDHPHRGTLAPSEFIEEAERSGLVLGMSDLIMARAAHRLGALARTHPDMYFSFNITPTQLRDPSFGQRLSELFRPDTLPRNQVLLEVTERDWLDPLATNALAVLQRSGWRVAIDDFGTGQSSLAALERLRVDRIKIDRAFVSAIDTRTVSRPVLDAIVTLAKQLDIRLIAEGVETRSQWDYLASRGVQYAQGYLIARPMSIDAFARWLPERRGEVTAAAAGAALIRTQNAAPIDAQTELLLHQLGTPGGVDIRDRVFRLRSYANCFVGREAVDWIARSRSVGRAEAVLIGRRLLALGMISHVVNEHEFDDAELFYRLTIPTPDHRWLSPAADDLKTAIVGPRGIPLHDHLRGLIRHRRCATGRSIVEWMVAKYRVPRAIAMQWVFQLMGQGALRHVYDDQPFRDDRSLYRPG